MQGLTEGPAEEDDMKRETYKGRKLQTTKGTDYGYSRAKINGVDLGRHLGNEDAAMTWMKNTIDFIDREDVNGDRWGAKWYAPGTYELCEHDHPKTVGTECLHSYCVSRRPAPVVDETPAEAEEPTPSYNVFVDDATTGRNVFVFNQPRAYDASALANHFVDEGYHVDTDLWDDVVRDAMLSPEMHDLCDSLTHADGAETMDANHVGEVTVSETSLTLPDGWTVTPSDDMTEVPEVVSLNGQAVATIRFLPNAHVPIPAGEGSYLADRFEWRTMVDPASGKEESYEDALSAAVSWVQKGY